MTFDFLSFRIPNDGYGYASHCIGNHLIGIDPSIGIVDMCRDTDYHGYIGDGREWHSDRLTVAMCTPDWLPEIHAPKIIVFTMFEATRLPTGWVEYLNRKASAVIVPCTWNAESFKANGVTVPIHICKLGIETRDYGYIERLHVNRPYTFLWSGTPDKRKGWDVAYKAFCKAFAGDPQAKLILHFRQPINGNPQFDDANVETMIGMLSHEKQKQLLSRADCYVFPSRGEGWGSPPREASATGLPTITTRYGGLAEDIDYWAIPLSIKSESKAEYGSWGCDLGLWGEPDEGECAELMRWVFEHRNSAAYHARGYAHWLANYANYDITAKRLIEIVSQYQ